MTAPSQVEACRRKESYPYTVARRLARIATRKADKLIVPYRCQVCRKWHIGSKEKR